MSKEQLCIHQAVSVHRVGLTGKHCPRWLWLWFQAPYTKDGDRIAEANDGAAAANKQILRLLGGSSLE